MWILDGGPYQPISPQGQWQAAVAPEAPVFSQPNILVHTLIVAADASLLGASVEQRMLIRNYDSGDSNIDVFVASFLQAENGPGEINGQATAPGMRSQAHGLPVGAAPVRNNAFVSAAAMGPRPNPANPASLHKLPFVLAHEIGHVLLDAGHILNNVTQLMTNEAPDDVNHVAAAKRIAGDPVSVHVLGTGIEGVEEEPAPVPLLDLISQFELMRSWTPNGHN